MKEIKTKEELIKENVELSVKVAYLKENEDKIKEEFAKAFNWTESEPDFYGRRFKLKTPSWNEIFIQIGRLLAKNDFIEDHLRINNIGREIDNYIAPELKKLSEKINNKQNA